jgi:hypothetical protein
VNDVSTTGCAAVPFVRSIPSTVRPCAYTLGATFTTTPASSVSVAPGGTSQFSVNTRAPSRTFAGPILTSPVGSGCDTCR